MSDFWSSALNRFGVGSDASSGSRFVGQTVVLEEGNKLHVKKVIAKGRYGHVFIAQDTKTGKDYALKRQVVPTENVKLIKQEIAFLKQLADHPHIIQFMMAASCCPTMLTHGSTEFLIQTELCSGGRMEDIVVLIRLTPRQVLRVFHETCLAVAHMHSQDPPIIHRDLKVENLLLSTTGAIKLCDFGSATTERLHPDRSWTAVQRRFREEEIQRNTTLMYRAPEMIDLYSNSPINESADVWALGCLLYKLCYQEHPFEDSARLRILCGNYRMPANDNTYTVFQGIICSCLVVDPTQRPSVDSIVAQLYIIADQLGENLDQPSTESLIDPAAASAPDFSEGASGMQTALQSTRHFFGFMKKGAKSLFKTIKESSTRAIVESISEHRETRPATQAPDEQHFDPNHLDHTQYSRGTRPADQAPDEQHFDPNHLDHTQYSRGTRPADQAPDEQHFDPNHLDHTQYSRGTRPADQAPDEQHFDPNHLDHTQYSRGTRPADKVVIADVMEVKGVSVAEIPDERRFDPNHLDRIERSKRYFRCKAFAWFGYHMHKVWHTICHRHWSSAHAWCIMDLKTQQIIYYFSQKCQSCEGSANPSFDEEALRRMAEWAVDTFLRRTGRLRRDPLDLTNLDRALDLHVDVDDSKGPHDQARCDMCIKLGRSCLKKSRV